MCWTRLVILIMVIAPIWTMNLLPLQEQLQSGQVSAWRLVGFPQDLHHHDVRRNPVLYISGQGQQWQRRAFLNQSFRSNPDGPQEFIAQGEPELHIRHRFTSSGSYTWQLRHNDHELARGSFLVRSGSALPRLAKHPSNPFLIATEFGEPFIPIGPNICWATGNDRLHTISQFFSSLRQHQGNHTRLWCASWSGQFANGNGSDWRLEQAWLLDEMLNAAAEHQLYVTLVIDNHHDCQHGKHFPYGDTHVDRIRGFFSQPLSDHYQAKLLYLFARYGSMSHIAAWELFNEVDEAFRYQEIITEDAEQEQLIGNWLDAATDFFKTHDQDQHLRTISLANKQWPAIIGHPGLDLLQFHSYIPPLNDLKEVHKDGVNLLAREIPALLELERPFCFSEVGFNGTNDDNEGNDLDYQGLLLQQQAWAGLLLGGYGSGMSWWWDTYIAPNDLWHHYQHMATICRGIDWRDGQLRPLTPGNQGTLRILGWQSPYQGLLWPQIRSDTWHSHVYEGRSRPQFTDLTNFFVIKDLKPNTKFTLERWAMTDGSILATTTFTSNATGKAALDLSPNCGQEILLFRPSLGSTHDEQK